jgi:hypothetical protein
MKWIVALTLPLFLSSCASIPQDTVGPDNILRVNVIGERQFSVGTHKYSSKSLALVIKKLSSTRPDLSLYIFIPSNLLGAATTPREKESACGDVVGYRVQVSVPRERQRFFEWNPGDTSSKEIYCLFAVTG